MSYNTRERDAAILLVGEGNADFTHPSIYVDLEKFNWITLHRLNGRINKASLTYSGRYLFKRLLKDK
jgi:hypothetical protein